MRTLLTLAGAVVVALAAAPTAQATISCAYNSGSKSLSITSDGNSDSPQVGRASGSTTIVVRSDATTVVACSGAGTPTVTTVDTISYNDIAAAAQNSMTVDLSNGPLAPGATAEAGCCSEIEMNFNMGTSADSIQIRGSDSAESIRAGTPGAGEIDVNLNADEAVADQDVHVIQVSQFVYDLAGGDDVVDMRGGAATGSVLTVPGSGKSGDGNDTIVDGDGQNYPNGGAGDDTITGGSNLDVVTPGPGDDAVDGGAGAADSLAFFNVAEAITIDLRLSTPQATGQGTDTYAGVEGIYGGSGSDVLVGDDGPNSLTGGDGDDRIAGGGGDDYLEGGTGFDTADYAEAAAPVTVKLGFNMQPQDTVGAGTDHVSEFEGIRGGPFADTLTGDGGGNVLEGLGGADVLAAGGGPDMLLLRDGEGDNGDCGAGLDTAVTDVPGLDTLTDCEISQAAEPAPAGGGGDGGAGGGGAVGGGGAAGGATSDTTAPVLAGLGLRPRAFRARRGARLRFTASEAGRLLVTLERCRATKPARCRRARRLALEAAAGTNALKLVTKGLRPGRYRARVIARDAAGNRSAPQRVAFRIRR